MDLDAVRAAPGVVGVLTAPDVPAQRREPGGQARRPGLRRGQGRVPRAADVRGRSPRRATRRGGRRRSRRSSIATCRTSPTWRRRWTADYPFVTEPLKLERGEVAPAMAAAPQRLKGRMRVGGQDHFYLEGMIAFAVPGEDDEVTVYSSTQHPSEVQHMVAHVLGVPSNAVTIIVRRMGGGLRRQGDAAEPLRGGGGGGGEEVEPGGEDPARPRRRHGGDRQAARFPQRLRGRVRRRRADPGGRRDASRRAAGSRRT